jgi:hypothetical protein
MLGMRAGWDGPLLFVKNLLELQPQRAAKLNHMIDKNYLCAFWKTGEMENRLNDRSRNPRRFDAEDEMNDDFLLHSSLVGPFGNGQAGTELD